ncbi:elongation of very long chain fatty acids protein-like [Tropilaelaps mercedesae]|uniref:Elongation of very long chain fatty acids protein-like n=1 Tax=Tropilaelaps mercedesae TaxID=418985 RepID=A0A1V9XKU9_9ACAR|nr:elongation of very long chain fatty acids protein-like [Tropilaelaps mercedesae]
MNLSVFEWPPRDPRTREWIFIETWTPSLLLVSLYAFTVKVVLPLWMRGRNPFNVVQYIRAYNIFMVVANAWFLVKLGSR